MVKGLNRRVVVIKPAPSSVFEQAIFIMRDGAQGVDEDALVREACASAERYVRVRAKGSRVRIPAPAFAAAGAAITGAAWLMTLLK